LETLTLLGPLEKANLNHWSETATLLAPLERANLNHCTQSFLTNCVVCKTVFTNKKRNQCRATEQDAEIQHYNVIHHRKSPLHSISPYVYSARMNSSRLDNHISCLTINLLNAILCYHKVNMHHREILTNLLPLPDQALCPVPIQNFSQAVISQTAAWIAESVKTDEGSGFASSFGQDFYLLCVFQTASVPHHAFYQSRNGEHFLRGKSGWSVNMLTHP
jgi:hypothetical protein